MLAALGEDDRRASLSSQPECVLYDEIGASLIHSERAVNLLDAGIGREHSRIEGCLAAYDAQAQLLPCALRATVDLVTDWAALHRDDRVVSVAPIGRRREAGHATRGSGSQHPLGRDRGNVVALVDDDVPVTGQQL